PPEHRHENRANARPAGADWPAGALRPAPAPAPAQPMPARHKPAARLPSAGRWIGDAPTAIVLAAPDRQGSVHTRANPVHEPPHRTAGGVAPTRPVSASAAVAHPP